jgi:uncharacterized protein
MLLNYAFKNFQSFYERTEVDLELGGKAPARRWEGTTKDGRRVTTALGVFGANAAGKTALLKPLAFIDWFIENSFSFPADSSVPAQAHFAHQDEPTEIEFEMEDEDDRQIWRYELKIDRQRVLREALYKKQVRFSYVFIREWDEDNQKYSIKQQGFGLSQREAEKVRQNASLISTAAQYDVPLAKFIAAQLAVFTNVDFFGRRRWKSKDFEIVSEIFSGDDHLRKKMVEALKRWDLGLADFTLDEVEDSSSDGATNKKWKPFGVHDLGNGKYYKLPLEMESSGTQTAFLLLGQILPALYVGGIALIDEMESDLHPMLVESIVNLFADPEANKDGAQLIFTCHSPSVLNLLQKAQVMFVEKSDGVSEAYRGDEIEGLRIDDNLRAKYESGALGAVPRF